MSKAFKHLDKKPKKMTAKLEDDLDSLNFSAIRRLLERICKSLGFRLFHQPLSFAPVYVCWHLDVDDDTVVFLDGHNRDEFRTAKDLLRGILNSRIFKIRHVGSFEERTIQNPFYRLSLPALQIKLDLLA